MLPIQSSTVPPFLTPSQRSDFDEPPALECNISSRIKKASNCCNACHSTWSAWRKNIAEIIPCIVDSNKKNNAMPATINIIIANRGLASSFNIDIPYNAAKAIYPTIKNPIEIIMNHQHCAQFFSKLDSVSSVDTISTYRAHLYSRLLMDKLNIKYESKIQALHTLIHRQYCDDNNKRYPIMKTDGSEYYIKSISKAPLHPEKTTVTSSCQVKKYISPVISPDERASLYDKFLIVRQFNSNDFLPASEASLKRQYGVFARIDIPANLCIGVHGGTLLFLKYDDNEEGDLFLRDLYYCLNMDYLVSLDNEDKMVLDGKNAISKINSRFTRRGNGKWLEDKQGFNTESVAFECTMNDGKKLKLDAIFTTEMIKKGSEIRLSYGYKPHFVEQMMLTQENISNTTIEALTSVLEEYLDLN